MMPPSSAKDMLMQVKRYANGGTASAGPSSGLAKALANGLTKDQYHQNVRAYLAKTSDPRRMAEGGKVETEEKRYGKGATAADLLAAEQRVLAEIKASPGTWDAGAAYNAIIESGVSVKDALEAGVKQSTIDSIFKSNLPLSGTALQATAALPSGLGHSDFAGQTIDQIATSSQNYLNQLMQDNVIDEAERREIQRIATARGLTFQDIQAAGIDPNVLFNVPTPVTGCPPGKTMNAAGVCVDEVKGCPPGKTMNAAGVCVDFGVISCPSPEMRILLSDGSYKPAGDLLVEDKVRTQHETTLEWGDHAVTHVSLIPNEPRLMFKFDGLDFVCSHSHKFYTEEGKWVEAATVAANDMLSGKTVLEVIESSAGPVVSITVADAHTYVCEGLLSHNKSLQPFDCPAGQTRNAAGVCVATVVTPDPCPTGQTRNAAGVCVATVVTPDPCPTGKTRNAAGVCVATVVTPDPCPTGKTRNAAGVCVDTPVTTTDLVTAVTPTYTQKQLQDLIDAENARKAALGTTTNPIDTSGSAATGSKSGVTTFLDTYKAPTPFVAPTYTAPTVYQQLPTQPDIYGAGQTALDTAFRDSAPRTAIAGMPGQFNYTTAAKLRPATGAGYTFTPPSVTSRPRSLLGPQDVQAYGGLGASKSQQFSQNRATIDRTLRAVLGTTPALQNTSNYNMLRNRIMSGEFGDPQVAFDPATAEGQRLLALVNSLSPTAAAAPSSQNITGGSAGTGTGSTAADDYAALVEPLGYGGYRFFNRGGSVKKSEGSAQEELARFADGGLIDKAIQKGAEALGFDSERQIAISQEAADLTNQMADAGLIEDQYRVQLVIPEDVTKRTRLNTGIKGDEEVFNAVNHALFAYDAGQSTLGKMGAQAKELYQGLSTKMAGGNPRSEYLDYFNNKFGFNLAEQGLSREEAKRAIMSNLGNFDGQGTRGRQFRGEEIKGGTDLLTNAQDAKYPWEKPVGYEHGGYVTRKQDGGPVSRPMSNAELLAQIDRSMANSPAPAYGTASSAPDREVTESQNMLQRFTSLNTPQDMGVAEILADIGMGFVPVVGTAQGARDFERARRDSDKLGMVLSAASMIPVVGGAVKAVKGIAKGVKTAAEELSDLGTYYHGTYKNILDPAGNLNFKTGRRGAVFLTPDPNFAAKYALNDDQLLPNDIDRMINQGTPVKEGATIYPVTPNVLNTFDINNKDHLAKLKSVVTVGGAQKARWKPIQEFIGQKIREESSWVAVERLLPDIKTAGFDSAFIEEMGRRNLAVFDPKNIEPAWANKGVKTAAEDRSDLAPLAAKAQGGYVTRKQDGGPVSRPMSNAELLAQIDRIPATTPDQDPSKTESQNMLQRFTSLNTPQDMSLGEIAADIALGFAPVVGTAQGLRDFERARRDDDTLGMVLSAASMIPVVGGAVKAARTVGKASKAADDLAALRNTPNTENALSGYDTDFPITHESSDLDFDGVIRNEMPDNVFDGIFGLNGVKGNMLGVGRGVNHTYLPRTGKVARSGDVDLEYGKSVEFLKKQFPKASDDQIDSLYRATAEDAGDFSSFEDGTFDGLLYGDAGERAWMAQNLRGKMAVDQGFDAVAMSDENGTSYFIPYGSKAKNIGTNFDWDSYYSAVAPKAADDLAALTARAPLDMSQEARMARAQEGGFDTDRTVYRGLHGEYDPEKAGNYQMFTSSPEDAGEYGSSVVSAYLRKGNNLIIDGGRNNFNSIPVRQLPDNVRANLHPSIGSVARTDDIAYAAQAAGYDSVSINNVFDKASNEIPLKPPPARNDPMSQEMMDLLDEVDASGMLNNAPDVALPPEIPRNYDPTTIDIIFDPSNIRSINAAFDPAKRGSGNLSYAQGGYITKKTKGAKS